MHLIARAVVVADGKLLLARAVGQSNTFLPGGHIEDGESALRTVEREFMEEFGQAPVVGEFLGVIEHQYVARGERHFEILLHFAARLPDLAAGQAPVSREPALEFFWADLGALEALNLQPWPTRELVRARAAGRAGPAWGSSIAPRRAELGEAARPFARELAAASVAAGDATGWFEQLYAQAHQDPTTVPWADLVPNPHLTEWLARKRIVGGGRTAAVVGCGLGDDAEALADSGFKVTAFDVAPSSIAWAKKRFPVSKVAYETADLFKIPAAWSAGFDLVFEAYTLQALPATVRPAAIAATATLVAPGGTLLVVARGREPSEPEGSLPWPLTRDELRAFDRAGLVEQSFEDFADRETPRPGRRFRIRYQRPSG